MLETCPRPERVVLSNMYQKFAVIPLSVEDASVEGKYFCK